MGKLYFFIQMETEVPNGRGNNSENGMFHEKEMSFQTFLLTAIIKCVSECMCGNKSKSLL